MKLSQLKNMIREELEMFARTPGSGHAAKLTPKGTSTWENIKKTRTLPEDLALKHAAILKFLYNAEAEGKRVQRIDYAESIGKAQQNVNADFNYLEEKGYVMKDRYVGFGKPGGGGSGKPKPSIEDLLGDEDLGDLGDL